MPAGLYSVPDNISNADPIVRMLIDGTNQTTFGKAVNFGALPVANRLCLGPRTIFMSENLMGWPPGSAYDANDNGDTEIVPGWQQYETTLKNEGYKNNGVATLLQYPGGLDAYFDRFCKPTIKMALALNVDRDKVVQSAYWNLSYVPTSDTMGKVAAWSGFVLMNTEMFFPLTDPWWYSSTVDPLNGTTGRTIGSYLYIYRAKLAVVLGRTPTDEELSDSFYSVVLDGLVLKTIAYIKELCPKALVIPYAWPNSIPLFCSYPATSIGHLRQVDEINSGKLDRLFTRFDGICPTRYHPYKIVPDGTNPVPAGSVTPATMEAYNAPCDIRTRLVKSRTGTPIYPWINPANGDNSPLTETEWRWCCSALNLAGADGAVIWSDPSYMAGADTAAKIANVELALSRLAPYFNGIARTNPP